MAAEAAVAEVEPSIGSGGSDSFSNLPSLRGRYFVDIYQRLPQLDSPSAQAYLTHMRADRSRQLFTLICDEKLPPRIDALEALRAFNLPGMLKPMDWGMIESPVSDKRQFVVVMDRPGGSRVMPSLDQTQPPLGEDDLITGFLQPLMPSLKELAGRGVCHRGIRPTNLFHFDAARRQMTLGEGYCAPPGYDQPAIFETIESAMCHPAGRGSGSQSNDMYALGVTLLFLLLGRNPVGDLDNEKLLQAKIEMSSYVALAGQVRVPINMIELLRGLLVDDTRERWTVNDLDMWLSGRRQSPKQTKLPPRASRPFAFGSGEFFNTRALAHALATDYRQAIGVVRSKSLDSWLRRSLTDEVRADGLQAAIYSTATAVNAKGAEDRLVARASIVMDPLAPIRYRGVGVMVDGIGAAMATSLNEPDQRQLLSEIISARLPIHWVAAQTKPRAEDVRVGQMMEKLPALIDQSGIGYGFERVVYELNPILRCLSPLMERDYVVELTDLLPALDRLAQRPDRPDNLIDRHLVAFVAARARRANDDLLRVLANNDPIARPIAVLRLYAAVQEGSDNARAPALAQWLLMGLGPALAAFHHRGRRDRIDAKLKAAATDGNLTAMLAIIDDNTERQADAFGFKQARAEYQAIDRTVRGMEATTEQRQDEARLLGEQVAAAIGGLIVSIATALTMLLRVL